MSRSRKAQLLEAWTKDVNHNVSQFQQGVELMIRKHQKSNIKTSSWAITLKEMSQHEASKPIRDVLESLALGLNDAENHRLAIMSSMQLNIASQFSKYDSRLKVQESNINIRNKSYLAFNKKQSDYLSARGRSKQKVQDHKKALLEEEKKRLQAAEDIINNSVGVFEHERISDMKAYLKSYLNSQIYFFSRCLEVHTAAYEKVMLIDPEAEKINFVKELKNWEAVEQADDVNTGTTAAMPSFPSNLSLTASAPIIAAPTSPIANR
jgi:hypothetical protein